MSVAAVRLATISARRVFWSAVLRSSSSICIEEIYRDTNTRLMVQNTRAPRITVLNGEDCRSVRRLRTTDLMWPLLEPLEQRLRHSFWEPTSFQHKVYFLFHISFTFFIISKRGSEQKAI